MAITFACPCGKSYIVADNLAGKRTRCPVCQASFVVPAPAAPVEEPLEDLEVVDYAPATTYGLAVESKPTRVTFDDEGELVRDEEPEVVDEDGQPKYFLAVYDGSKSVVHKPRVFRVYLDGDELLFVWAGPFSWGAIDALAMQGHVAASAFRAGLAAGGAEAGLAVGLAGAALTAISDAAIRRQMTKRQAELDPMTMDQLRSQADGDKTSFRVNSDNTTDARIGPPAGGIWANKDIEATLAGHLYFRHDRTGKWDLMLLTHADAKAAIRAFRRVLGKRNVDMELRLPRHRD
jgi:hypothetical protein